MSYDGSPGIIARRKHKTIKKLLQRQRVSWFNTAQRCPRFRDDSVIRHKDTGLKVPFLDCHQGSHYLCDAGRIHALKDILAVKDLPVVHIKKRCCLRCDKIRVI